MDADLSIREAVRRKLTTFLIMRFARRLQSKKARRVVVKNVALLLRTKVSSLLNYRN